MGQACSFTYNFTTKGGTGLFFHLQLYHQRWDRLVLSLTTLPPKVGQACSLHLQLYHQRWDRHVLYTYTITTKVGTVSHLQLYHQRWDRLILYTYVTAKGGTVSHLQHYHQRWDRFVVCTYNFTTKGETVTHLQLYHQACSLHLQLYHQRWDTFTLQLQLYHQRWDTFTLHLQLYHQRWDTFTLHLQLYHQRWETLLHHTYNITTKHGTHFYITPTTIPPKVGQLCYWRWGGFVVHFQQLYQVTWDRLCSLCLQLFCWLWDRLVCYSYNCAIGIWTGFFIVASNSVGIVRLMLTQVCFNSSHFLRTQRFSFLCCFSLIQSHFVLLFTVV